MSKIHIGKLIKQKFDENPINVTEFAKQINCTPQNIYHYFELPTMDINKLEQIGNALDFDFIKEIYLKQYIFAHPIQINIQLILSNIKNIETYNNIIDKLKEIEILVSEQ